MIVRGLAAIILVALNGKTPRELLATDIELFEQLDLFRHISTRGNGLRAMVGKIRDIMAAEAARDLPDNGQVIALNVDQATFRGFARY